MRGPLQRLLARGLEAEVATVAAAIAAPRLLPRALPGRQVVAHPNLLRAGPNPRPEDEAARGLWLAASMGACSEAVLRPPDLAWAHAARAGAYPGVTLERGTNSCSSGRRAGIAHADAAGRECGDSVRR